MLVMTLRSDRGFVSYRSSGSFSQILARRAQSSFDCLDSSPTRGQVDRLISNGSLFGPSPLIYGRDCLTCPWVASADFIQLRASLPFRPQRVAKTMESDSLISHVAGTLPGDLHRQSQLGHNRSTSTCCCHCSVVEPLIQYLRRTNDHEAGYNDCEENDSETSASALCSS